MHILITWLKNCTTWILSLHPLNLLCSKHTLGRMKLPKRYGWLKYIKHSKTWSNKSQQNILTISNLKPNLNKKLNMLKNLRLKQMKTWLSACLTKSRDHKMQNYPAPTSGNMICCKVWIKGYKLSIWSIFWKCITKHLDPQDMAVTAVWITWMNKDYFSYSRQQDLILQHQSATLCNIILQASILIYLWCLSMNSYVIRKNLCQKVSVSQI